MKFFLSLLSLLPLKCNSTFKSRSGAEGEAKRKRKNRSPRWGMRKGFGKGKGRRPWEILVIFSILSGVKTANFKRAGERQRGAEPSLILSFEFVFLGEKIMRRKREVKFLQPQLEVINTRLFEAGFVDMMSNEPGTTQTYWFYNKKKMLHVGKRYVNYFKCVAFALL